MLPQCTPQSPLVQKKMMEMVAELLGSQSFAETLLGKMGLAVGSLMELYLYVLELTFFGFPGFSCLLVVPQRMLSS